MTDKKSLGLERNVFQLKDYPKIMESRKINENYLDKMDILDVEIKDRIFAKTIPLIFKEHFYKNKSTPEKSELPVLVKLTKLESIEGLGVLSANESDDDIDTLPIRKLPINDELFQCDKPVPELIERISMSVIKRVDHDILKIVQRVINSENIPENLHDDESQDIFEDKIEMALADDEGRLPDENRKTPHKPINSKKALIFDTHVSVIFLLHGLEGSSNDLRNLQSLLQTYLPKSVFYRSEINEENTSASIETLGLKFAGEVRNFMDNYINHSKMEISFIGHSLGGLIARAAFPHLADYKSSFKTYVGISTPHLGSLSSKFLVNTGMKFLSQMKSNQSIRQMALDDEEQYLLGLSRADGLNWFLNIVLIGVQEDGYVPFESSQLLINWKNSNGNLTQEMAGNIYSRLDVKNLVKLKLHLPGGAKGFDVFLGRQAHIELIENAFLKELVFSHIREFL